MSEALRVKRSVAEKVFEIVKLDPTRQRKHPKAPHQWFKKKAEAQRVTGLSRPTIDKLLDAYPQGISPKAKKVESKTVEEFNQTETARIIREIYTKRFKHVETEQWVSALRKQGASTYNTLRDAWKMRGKKEPVQFDLDDFLFFWGTTKQAPPAEFVDPMTGKITFNRAIALRFAMKMNIDPDIKTLPKTDPRFTTKGLKRRAGLHKHEYLMPPDLINVVNHINEPDTLLLLYCGTLMGGRFSALGGIRGRNKGLTVSDIHRQQGYIVLHEIKVDESPEKDLWDFALDFIWQYVIDFKRTDKLFSYDIDEYNDRLRRAGKEAGIAWKTTTHVTLKHTCITLMGLHGIDIDVISDYVGTDPETIMKFYRGGGREKIRAQILGLTRVEKTWKQLWQELTPKFKERYDQIKTAFKPVDGIKLLGA